MCCGTEIGLAIVEAVVVYVVNEEMVGDIDNLAVHSDGTLFFVYGVPDLSLCVIGESALVGVPFVNAEAWVVFGVHDSVFTLGEWDSAEGVAEAEAAKV